MAAFPYRRVHFIGVAGVGMSATALLLRDSGVAVTGSDEAIYPPISDVLKAEKLIEGDVQVEKIVDLSFLNAVLKELGPYQKK